MIFQHEWILECIVMHMKSPCLYEHIRKHNIMVVPSPSCLRAYAQKCRSGSDFNDEVLTTIAEKATTVDPYHQHDSTFVKEMKHENATVNSKGQVDDFVDLG
uniref:Uncharacterized protein n=1 Tax=Rhipicephalus appendiculatus TaxID=34631 RepID=A0A131YFV5_RHIAP